MGGGQEDMTRKYCTVGDVIVSGTTEATCWKNLSQIGLV